MNILSNRNDLKNVLVLKELGSGLNSKRKKLLKLIDMILNDEVNRIFITYKERLTRFGFEYIETIYNHHNVEINDLEELLGEAKVAELFIQHYIKLVGDKLHISEDLKGIDLFNLE